jgi:hypothetical protein
LEIKMKSIRSIVISLALILIFLQITGIVFGRPLACSNQERDPPEERDGSERDPPERPEPTTSSIPPAPPSMPPEPTTSSIPPAPPTVRTTSVPTTIPTTSTVRTTTTASTLGMECEVNQDCSTGLVCCARKCRDPSTGVCRDLNGDGIPDWVPYSSAMLGSFLSWLFGWK